MPQSKVNISELIARMPDVDLPKKPEPKKKKDGEPQDEQPPKPEPPPDPNRAGKFTGPDPEVADKVFAAIVAGGNAALEELIDQLHAPSDPQFVNYKAQYVLHGLAIYLGEQKQEEPRQLLSKSLATALGGAKHSKAAKALLIQELQTLGGPEAISALGKQLLDDEVNEPATRALIAIHDGEERKHPGPRVVLGWDAVTQQFLSALPKLKGRSRLNVIQGLGKLGGAAIAPLKQVLNSETDRDARLAAASALANLGEGSSTQALLDMSDKAEGWERMQLTNACFVLAEKFTAIGRKQEATRIYTHLRDTRTEESEHYVRDAATRALQGRAEKLSL